MAKVYFISSNSTTDKKTISRQIDAVYRECGMERAFERGDLSALKLHVGEPGCDTSVSPEVVRPLVKHMKAAGAKPFLTDTAVLYKGPRDNGVTHSVVAQNRGFGISRMYGAPFIPADGLIGADEVEIPLEGGRYYDKVTIASAIMQARSMLVLSHATGHLATGLGGALKNLGMGCGSKKAKLRQHYGQEPRIKENKCIACNECAEWCPSEAITVEETARIDSGKCIGCGECIAVCLTGAVAFDWSIMGRELQERIVEHAAAIVRAKPGRICYLTVACNITKDCDCMGTKQRPVVEDLGIFASFDPVAIDKAVIDAVKEKAGQTLESLSYPETNALFQIEYAESMGLGSSEYEPVEVG